MLADGSTPGIIGDGSAGRLHSLQRTPRAARNGSDACLGQCDCDGSVGATSCEVRAIKTLRDTTTYGAKRSSFDTRAGPTSVRAESFEAVIKSIDEHFYLELTYRSDSHEFNPFGGRKRPSSEADPLLLTGAAPKH